MLCRWRRLWALRALWVGLLYDASAMDAAWDMVKDWTAEEHALLRREVPRRALHAEIRGRTVRELAAETLEIAHGGLRARDRLDGAGNNETGFLDTLDEIVERGSCPAERKLDLFNGAGRGSVNPVFKDYAY